MQLWKGLTWREAMRISWLILWRACATTFLLSTAIGGVMGLFSPELTPASLAEWSARIESAVALICYPAIVFIIVPAVVSQLLRKRFKGFRLTIVRDASYLSAAGDPTPPPLDQAEKMH